MVTLPALADVPEEVVSMVPEETLKEEPETARKDPAELLLPEEDVDGASAKAMGPEGARMEILPPEPESDEELRAEEPPVREKPAEVKAKMLPPEAVEEP